jgi:protoheme IX farnesyltransferase
MARTCRRPLVTGQVSPGAAWRLGVVLSVLGLACALLLSPLFAALVTTGLFFEIVVYTVWLKRRTAWSILVGGVAGGMPILAGRALATGEVDRIGLLLALAVLFWVPTHNLTLSMRHLDDYRRAGVPTFPLTYGRRATHGLITCSGALAAMAMTTAFVWVGLPAPILWTSSMLGAGLICLALLAWIRPSETQTTVLFKYASLYMLGSMLLLSVGGLM